VFDNGENPAGAKNAASFGDQTCVLLRVDVMEDADRGHPVNRVVLKWKAKRVGLMHNLKVPTFGDHTERYIAPQSSREMRFGSPQQFPLAASNIQPDALPCIHSFASRKFEEQVDLSRKEELRSRGEVLTPWMVKQFFVFGRVAIEFRIRAHSFGHRIGINLCRTMPPC
jgi:hypothetical protein